VLRGPWGVLGRLAPCCVALALVGCGGGDDGDRPTRSEFIAAADQICREAQSESESLQGRLNGLAQGRGNTPAELDQAAGLLRRLAIINRSIVRQIGELRAPPEDRAVIERLLATGERSVALGLDLADAYESASENPARSEIPVTAAALEKTAARSRRLAHGYGLEICGGAG
jgi:hypothetical protein